MQRRTKREAARYSRTVLFTVLCIIIALLTNYALMEISFGRFKFWNNSLVLYSHNWSGKLAREQGDSAVVSAM